MKNSISISTKRYFLILACGLIITAAATYFITAEAVTVKTVGTLSSTLVPNSGNGVGTEFVEFSYSGPGKADLSGWSLKNTSGVFMSLTGVEVIDDGSVRICEESSNDPKCDFHWTGDDIFSDTSDTLWVLDELGNSVINVSYTNSDISTIISSSADFKTAVYEKRDKIAICHDSKNSLQSKNVGVNSLVGSYEKDTNNNHMNHESDIIPSFIYDNGSGYDYFPGNNWPDSTGLHKNDCN